MVTRAFHRDGFSRHGGDKRVYACSSSLYQAWQRLHWKPSFFHVHANLPENGFIVEASARKLKGAVKFVAKASGFGNYRGFLNGVYRGLDIRLGRLICRKFPHMKGDTFGTCFLDGATIWVRVTPVK